MNKNLLFKKIISSIFILFFFLIFNYVGAVSQEESNNFGLDQTFNGTKLSQKFGNADVPQVIGNVISIIMGLSATVMFVIIIFAGFQWIFSGGNSKKRGDALKLITSSAIGIIIIVTAYALSQFVLNNIKFLAQ